MPPPAGPASGTKVMKTHFKVKNVVVGAGISGCTAANRIAETLGEDVLLIDARPHIGGNCFDCADKNGIRVHKYGAHIFHTDSKRVWDFTKRFTKWYPYMHSVRCKIHGMEVPIPFNMNSMRMLFPAALAETLETKLVAKFGFGARVAVLDLMRSRDRDLKFLAEFVYGSVLLNYTQKRWGLKPDEISGEVMARFPIAVSRDDRYFQNKYQGIPADGYAAMFKKMIAHHRIDFVPEMPFSKISGMLECDRIFYTGPIDEYFGYKFGRLQYRSLKFDFVEYDRPHFQSAAVINYPNNYDFTRISEYKYFLGQVCDKTTVSYEYPEPFEPGKNERGYPVLNSMNASLYAKYASEAKKLKNVHFFGRLGSYSYFDMDTAVLRAMELVEKIGGKSARG